MSADRIALGLGGLSLALMLGALGFQYLGGYPPCEMCMWQRYPHIAAAVIGILGGLLLAAGLLDRRHAPVIATLTILLVAASGVIAVYHAGVEWKWWKGPSTCTGGPFHGPLDLSQHVVLCDVAAWRFLGLSLAGYNAIVSLGAAALGAFALTRRRA
ncbi:MAG TPA: disulfide bond formation protein B [Rhizomicrobium sp.]|nr:disulfide bond formation protein B [Rhizomicrobium sp.]